jgi:hypothetical protein
VRSVVLTLGLLGVVVSCGGTTVPADGSVYEWGDTYELDGLDWANVALLVVDDADTPEAASVRQWIRDDLDETLTRYSRPGVVYNPAEWRPVDMSVVIAFPSAPPATRVVGPLRYVEHLPTEQTQATFMEAVAAAMDDLPIDRGAFLPIETFESVLALLSWLRSPTNDAERAVVDALPEPDYGVSAVLATSRDDEGSGVVAVSAVDSSIVEGPDPGTYVHVNRDALVPAGPADTPRCAWGLSLGTGRLGEWIDLNHVPAAAVGAGCELDDGRYNLIDNGVTDWSVRCVRPPAVDADGSAECRVTVETDDARCDESHAWIPSNVLPTDPAHVVCEVRQHAGADLETCRTVYDASLPSGWCWSEVARYEVADRQCSGARKAEQRLRFTGSARVGPGLLSIECAGP